MTGNQEPLFNPRKHKWAAHFKWSDGCTRITGITPIGRATENRLDLNKETRRVARLLWIETGTWP